MPDPAHGEFYVGYLPAAPRGIARFVRARVLGLAAAALGLALLLVASQAPFAKAVFEYGRARALEGWIEERPYPLLAVERPGGGVSRYLLTAAGKRGAADLARGLDGARVRAEGTLVYRDDQTMIELRSLDPLSGAARAPESGPEDLGPARLRGEIVDAKCYLGVMKPGNLKPHRSCAVRCISGGVPPVLVVRVESPERGPSTEYYLLVGPEGEAAGQGVLPFVAEPVEVTGRLERRGDLLVLRCRAADIRRL